MEEVDPGWRCAVVVCANERPAGHPRGSCGAATGDALRDWLRDRARQDGLKRDVVVHRGACMDVCGPGTTVAVLPRSLPGRVFTVTPGDRDALWAVVVASVTP